ncbi:TPA: StbB family protein [Pseudomonas aeruginosa]|jgi:hypothetical protein|uniref:Stability protein n=4 Tax=Pseudomonadaceae TaxID=135621 RepID=A0A8E3S6E5_ECTME|nr:MULTISPECIES: StbB family protein [Pseudomonas]AGA76275.1 StbB [Pseudomonas putida HB3267]AZZ88776.1 StbB [Pseudomonas putida]MBA5101830.1 StdB protein [Pseudomonas aeruginosa]MBG5567821.1 StdB protein [Pseudomonas aeruginosa]MBH3312409.1 StdB protein [Pseudomonas mosselii]
MKRAILNYSGSIGKTTIAAHLLYPRMPSSAFFAIESINQSALDLGIAEVKTMRGREVGDLIEELVLEDVAIIDIGASNIESFFEAGSRYHGFIDEIEQFIVPVTPEQKAWQESLKTVEALATMGVSADRIILLPNRIQDNPEAEIPSIYNYVKKTKKATIKPGAFLFDSDVYGYLAANKMSFDQLIGDDTDYKALARAEADETQRSKYVSLYRWTSYAKPIRQNLDECYAALTA